MAIRSNSKLNNELMQKFYNGNKPLLNSLLTGLFYFLFCWSIDFGDNTKLLFMILMLFLPGLTFPLTTCYFDFQFSGKNKIKIVSHVISSVAIYHGSAWLFSGEGQIKYLPIIAGFSGSLLLLLITKFLLKKTISGWQVFIAALLSGLAFVPYVIIERTGLLIGLAVFIWTVINGQVLNVDYKKATCSQQEYCQ